MPVNVLIVNPKVENEVDQVLAGLFPIVCFVISASRAETNAKSVNRFTIHDDVYKLYARRVP